MKKVLIVDDEPHVARVLRLYLTNAGYEVCYYNDSTKAREEFESVCPDLLVTDVKMPRLSGPDLVDGIRATESGASIPVILITSSLASEHKDWADDKADVHFVGKPVSPQELLDIIARRFSQAGAGHSKVAM